MDGTQILTLGLGLEAPWILKDAVDALESGVTSGGLARYAAAIVAVTLVSAIFRFFMRQTMIVSSRRIEYDLRNDFFAHLLTLDPESLRILRPYMLRYKRLWIAGFSKVAVRRAARVGASYIAVGPIGPFTKVYRDELSKQGRDPDDYEVAAGYAWLHVARDPEKRWSEAVEHLAYQQNCYGEWFAAAGMDFIKPVTARLPYHSLLIRINVSVG